MKGLFRTTVTMYCYSVPSMPVLGQDLKSSNTWEMYCLPYCFTFTFLMPLETDLFVERY